MGNRFNTAAGIARQFSAEQGKDLSRHTVSRRLRQFGLKAHSTVTKPLISQKNKKAIKFWTMKIKILENKSSIK